MAAVNPSGTVFWFTGLSGAGKSTLAREFTNQLRRDGRTVVLLDGDHLRELFDEHRGHGRADRLAIAMRNGRLCKFLADQGVDVVCATISLFHQCHDWNRAHIDSYREIHVRAPLEVLQARDSKGLYGRAARNEVTDVVGIDIPAEEPLRPDLVVDNDGCRVPADVVTDLWKALGL
jgi:adenylylsulfate kinase-like enzyme